MNRKLQKVVIMTYSTTDISDFQDRLKRDKMPATSMLYHHGEVEVMSWNLRKWITENKTAELLVVSDSAFICHRMLQENIPVLGIMGSYVEQTGQDHENMEASEVETYGEDFWGIPYVVESINDIDVTYLERIYRRFRGIPWDILETERCILREITVKDVPRIAEIYQSPMVKKYMEPLYEPIEREVAYTEDYIKNIYGFYEYGTWVIIEKTSGKIIGRAGLENYGNDQGDKIELGYLIDDAYQRQGYATEVCTAILQYAEKELGFTTVWTRIGQDNAASIQFCKRLGFIETSVSSKDGMILFYRERP